MQIKGTDWYTAAGRLPSGEVSYGYRRSVKDLTATELTKLVHLLKSDGINTILRISQHDHRGVPAGTPMLEIFDEESILAFEGMLPKGVLPADRYKEHGLEYINRPARKAKPPVPKSFWGRLFGRIR